MKGDTIEITMKDKRKYTFILDYDYTYNLLLIMDTVKLRDINNRQRKIVTKDIVSIRKVF